MFEGPVEEGELPEAEDEEGDDGRRRQHEEEPEPNLSKTGFNTSWEVDYGSSTVVKRAQYASQWHEFKCDVPIEPGVGATTFPTLAQA